MVLIDSVRRVAGRGVVPRPRGAEARKQAAAGRPAAAAVRHTTPSLQPGQLRRTRPDLPFIDAVDGPSDFIACPTPGCCAVRPLTSDERCPVCRH